jgi:tetratricopeptide (TPR) repeat protein
MNTRFAFQVSVFWIGLALSVMSVPKVIGQQEDATPTPEAISPDQAGESGMEQSDESVPETVEGEPEPPSPAEEAFQRAMQHKENNQLEEAIADCTEAIRLAPDNLVYLSTRAELYGEMHNYDKALEDADRILELDPTNLPARLLRGKMLDRSGDKEKALIEFNIAVEQNPTSLDSLSERQTYFERNDEHDKAFADGNRMIQLQPQLNYGYLAQATLHKVSGEYDQAMTYASAVIQQEPDDPIGYVTRAEIRAERTDFEGAKNDLNRAIEVSPDDPSALSVRATVHFQTGEYEKSLADLEKIVALEPQQCAFKAQLADFLATCPDDRLRDAARAAQLANEALELAPNDPVVWRACASAAAENRSLDEAINWQERVNASRALHPWEKYENEKRLEAYKSGQAYRQSIRSPNQELVFDRINAAQQAINERNFDQAIIILSELISDEPSDWVAYYGRGLAYSRQQKYHLALADLSVAIRFNSEEPEPYDERAFVLKNLGQYDGALDDYLKAESFDKNDKTGVRNNLAWLLATCPDDGIRDPGKAAEFVDEALQFHPDNGPLWDTCAAVFAAISDFEDAVDWEQAYIDRQDLSGDQRERGEKRLASYREHRPYRE